MYTLAWGEHYILIVALTNLGPGFGSFDGSRNGGFCTSSISISVSSNVCVSVCVSKRRRNNIFHIHVHYNCIRQMRRLQYIRNAPSIKH